MYTVAHLDRDFPTFARSVSRSWKKRKRRNALFFFFASDPRDSKTLVSKRPTKTSYEVSSDSFLDRSSLPTLDAPAKSGPHSSKKHTLKEASFSLFPAAAKTTPRKRSRRSPRRRRRTKSRSVFETPPPPRLTPRRFQSTTLRVLRPKTVSSAGKTRSCVSNSFERRRDETRAPATRASAREKKTTRSSYLFAARPDTGRVPPRKRRTRGKKKASAGRRCFERQSAFGGVSVWRTRRRTTRRRRSASKRRTRARYLFFLAKKGEHEKRLSPPSPPSGSLPARREARARSRTRARAARRSARAWRARPRAAGAWTPPPARATRRGRTLGAKAEREGTRRRS